MCVCQSVCLGVCLSVCLSVTSHISETSEAIAITFDTVTASVTRMYHVLIILTLTFIQNHTDINYENNMFDYVRNYSSKSHQVYCEDSLTKGLHDHCQFDDLELHSRPQVHLKLDYFLTCHYLGQYLSYYIHTWHDSRLMNALYVLLLVSMTLTLMQGHSG